MGDTFIPRVVPAQVDFGFKVRVQGGFRVGSGFKVQGLRKVRSAFEGSFPSA